MISERLLIVFPYVPLTALMLTATLRFVTGHDMSRLMLRVAQAVQLIAGTMLIIRFAYLDDTVLEVPLSVWQHSILLRFDTLKMYFMTAYLVPLLLSFLRRDEWSNPTLRMVFMFYLGGCSSLIVAGDVFNFFVAYELMIMAAYVLVAARGRYFPAVRYMFFGAASSVPFLAGIIVLYRTSGSLAFPQADMMDAWPQANLAWMLLFFTIAFMIKAAFFPVSAWVAACHSATVPVMSTFLGSFTIFSGIYGMVYLVLQPALAAGFEPAIMFLRWISMATLLGSGLFLFYEPDLKRCVAGSTVYTIGGIGLLLSGGSIDVALAYMVVHAAYKSAMFLIVDRLATNDGLHVRGDLSYLLAGGVATGIVAGLFPGMVHFLKMNIGAHSHIYQTAGLIAMTMFLGGFLKFRYHLTIGDGATRTKNWIWPVFVLTATALYAAVLGHYHIMITLKSGIEWGLAVVVAIVAAHVYQRTIRCAGLDRRWIFSNLNVELFFVLLLLAAGAVVMLV